MKQKSRPKRAAIRNREAVLTWIERVAAYVAEDGTPPIAGRILGWLMVCDPVEQTAADIAEAISASRASMTTNLRMLTAVGFVEKRTRPGQRTEFYRLVDNAWEKVVRRQVEGLATFRDVAQRGLELIGPNAPGAGRLREANQIFDWLSDVFDRAPPLPSGKRIRLDQGD